MTKEEELFFEHWKEKRKRKNAYLLKTFIIGLPTGIIFSGLILLCFISGWDKQVPLISTGMFATILVGLVVLALFYAYLKIQFRWEKNERYYEILKKKYTL